MQIVSNIDAEKKSRLWGCYIRKRPARSISSTTICAGFSGYDRNQFDGLRGEGMPIFGSRIHDVFQGLP